MKNNLHILLLMIAGLAFTITPLRAASSDNEDVETPPRTPTPSRPNTSLTWGEHLVVAAHAACHTKSIAPRQPLPLAPVIPLAATVPTIFLANKYSDRHPAIWWLGRGVAAAEVGLAAYNFKNRLPVAQAQYLKARAAKQQ